MTLRCTRCLIEVDRDDLRWVCDPWCTRLSEAPLEETRFSGRHRIAEDEQWQVCAQSDCDRIRTHHSIEGCDHILLHESLRQAHNVRHVKIAPFGSAHARTGLALAMVDAARLHCEGQGLDLLPWNPAGWQLRHARTRQLSGFDPDSHDAPLGFATRDRAGGTALLFLHLHEPAPCDYVRSSSRAPRPDRVAVAIEPADLLHPSRAKTICDGIDALQAPDVFLLDPLGIARLLGGPALADKLDAGGWVNASLMAAVGEAAIRCLMERSGKPATLARSTMPSWVWGDVERTRACLETWLNGVVPKAAAP